jgi:hypothetical protein
MHAALIALGLTYVLGSITATFIWFGRHPS